MRVQDHVASSVNVTGTDQKIDTPLTDPRSLDVHGQIQKQIDRAIMEVTVLSNIARAAGDLSTYYAANRAWRELYGRCPFPRIRCSR